MPAFQDSELEELAPQDFRLFDVWLRAEGLGLPEGVDQRLWAERATLDQHIWCRRTRLTAGVVVGFVRLDMAPDHAAEVTLVVSPAYRRRGQGRVLLGHARTEASRRGARRLVAQVRRENEVALRFFTSAGFELATSLIPGFCAMLHELRSTEPPPPLRMTL